jgi:hypothetical protein
MYVILLIVLILFLVGGLPHWGHMQRWDLGYFPSGIVGLILIVLLILVLMGRI